MCKCEWCEDGVCVYSSSLDEQIENEVFWDCNGTEEEQKDCGMLK